MSITVQHRRGTRTECEANTPAAGEAWFDTTLKAWRYGDGATLGGFLAKRWRYSYPVSPAQITANQNDYNPTDLAIGETLWLTSDAARSITGIVAGASGATMKIINRGAFDITLANASASSTAANRFLFDADIVLKANGSVELEYSVADSRWMRANGGTKFSTVPQEFISAGSITPAQITASQNDYAPVDSVTATKTTALASHLLLSTDASRNITGLVDPRDGVEKTIINVGTNPLVLVDASASSSAANRFDFGNNVTLAAKQAATIRYDGTAARWKLKASTAGASVAAGAVSAQTLAASAIAARAGMVNGTIAATNNGTAASYALKTLAGTDPSAADPVYFIFQDGAGGMVVRSQTAAVSWGFSSGSSAGTISSAAFIIHHVVLDNAGTLAFGAVNCRSGANIMSLTEDTVYSSTAEGGAGAADSVQTIYTAAAVTSKYLCYLGRSNYESGMAAAGTWNANPTKTVIWTPGMAKPGDVVSSSVASSGAVATDASANMPGNSDTVPVSTNGTQGLTVTSEPVKSKSNVFDIDYACAMLASSVASWGCIAIFQDAISAASASTNVYFDGAAARSNVGGRFRQTTSVAAGSTSTFKMRFGIISAGTATFNGSGGARFGGGVLPSQITVRELQG